MFNLALAWIPKQFTLFFNSTLFLSLLLFSSFGAGNEDAIEVYTPERPYTIYTQTRAEKTLWLTKLRETIYQHLRDHKKCEPDKDCNTGMMMYNTQQLYDL